MSDSALKGGPLFFARPKKRGEKKRRPQKSSSGFPALLAMTGLARRAIHGPACSFAHPCANPCGAKGTGPGCDAQRLQTGLLESPVDAAESSRHQGNCPRAARGEAMDGERQSAGQGCPVDWPPKRPRGEGSPAGAQSPGAISFGYFSLGMQRKVTRSKSGILQS